MTIIEQTGNHPFINEKGVKKETAVFAGKYIRIPRNGKFNNELIEISEQLMNVV
jgi:hypothetical protein